MPIQIIVDLMIAQERMEEFMTIITDDKNMAAEDKTILSFDIMVDSEISNKVQIVTTATDMQGLREHMAAKHYRWKDFMKSGGVISHKHTMC